MFKTKKGIVYQRVRLNGILVSQCNEKMNIWLDDGTDTIRVILSPRLLARMDAPKLINSASVTVFGLVKHLNNKEFVVQCGGFHVENDISNELYYNIKVLSSQPLSAPPLVPVNENSSNRNSSGNDKGSAKHTQKPAALFHSLSSQPSPPPKHPLELNLTTPEKKNPLSKQTTPISTPLHFVWSPEQPRATSTPLNREFVSIREPPLKLQANNMDQCLIEDDDDDHFGDINLSFTRIENEAIRSKPQKRRWEP
ncbi:hypothetical protein K501DRAFT_287101 [Backusella circina FSU 941]|nr:hypothetical protein K501DRAFT_287101 [Backusella circina FSU 941]